MSLEFVDRAQAGNHDLEEKVFHGMRASILTEFFVDGAAEECRFRITVGAE
jgi:hypothetical protein